MSDTAMSDTQMHGSEELHHDDGIPHASLREYLNGFVLSVVLTAIPFALVMTKRTWRVVMVHLLGDPASGGSSHAAHHGPTIFRQ